MRREFPLVRLGIMQARDVPGAGGKDSGRSRDRDGRRPRDDGSRLEGGRSRRFDGQRERRLVMRRQGSYGGDGEPGLEAVDRPHDDAEGRDDEAAAEQHRAGNHHRPAALDLDDRKSARDGIDADKRQ